MTSTDGTKLSLYGVQVPAADYESIKRIADALFGCTMTDEPEAEAKRRCVLIAMKARAEAANGR